MFIPGITNLYNLPSRAGKALPYSGHFFWVWFVHSALPLWHGVFPSVLREWLIMRRSLRYGTLIFREIRGTNEGITRSSP